MWIAVSCASTMGIEAVPRPDDGPTDRKEFVMAGTRSSAEGKADKAIGKIKKAAGKATGNRSLQVKGGAQQAKGTVKDAAGKAARRVTRAGRSA
jgi:uncharacterized protein YjbJ (UPF0337 family)